MKKYNLALVQIKSRNTARKKITNVDFFRYLVPDMIVLRHDSKSQMEALFTLKFQSGDLTKEFANFLLIVIFYDTKVSLETFAGSYVDNDSQRIKEE